MNRKHLTPILVAALFALLGAPSSLAATTERTANPQVADHQAVSPTSKPRKGGARPPAAKGKASPGRGADKARSKSDTAQDLRKRDCTRALNKPAKAPKVKTKPLEFEVRASDPVVNFGSNRTVKRNFIRLKASTPIPEGIYSTNFQIDSLEPMRRIGKAELESVRLPSPKYSPPHFINHRTELAFNLCVYPTGGDPGTYTGQFLFSGPGEIASVTLTQTAQLKATESEFLLPFVGILIITFIALGLRSYAGLKKEDGKKEIGAQVIVVLASGAAAGLAMYLLYSENLTWGEGGLILAGAALFAAAFTAAGLSAILSGGSPKLVETLGEVEKSRKDHPLTFKRKQEEPGTGSGQTQPGPTPATPPRPEESSPPAQ